MDLAWLRQIFQSSCSFHLLPIFTHRLQIIVPIYRNPYSPAQSIYLFFVFVLVSSGCGWLTTGIFLYLSTYCYKINQEKAQKMTGYTEGRWKSHDWRWVTEEKYRPSCLSVLGVQFIMHCGRSYKRRKGDRILLIQLILDTVYIEGCEETE